MAQNYGPLTTVFTAPSACYTAASGPGDGGAFWGVFCSYGFAYPASSCYPEGWKQTTVIGDEDGSYYYYGAFSPGIYCPIGWDAVYSITRSQSPWHTSDIGVYANLSIGQAATGCCPGGYTWATYQTCVSVATTKVTYVQYGVVTASSGWMSGAAISGCRTTTVTNGVGPDGLSIFAAPVVLVNDLSSSSESVATATAISAGTSNSEKSGGSSSGLSTGAKIAIGICFPLGMIILATIWFIWRHRRRRASKIAPRTESVQPSEPVAEAYTGKAELEGGRVMRYWDKPELDVQNNEYQDPPPDTAAELAG
ncbi:hypothetical protein N7510_009274 [Penicillium lagena]|uniref:uncharacterized protein n=1 Tax=Penicillium lagena TaxID=94218 RepID=UPI0025422CEF|nr:uncharacterized protein N7510_009274 [Penicillium lagena]KAJ5606493.1 hypothetical protein N7510_009274 [Penicillium lagena]